MKHLFVAFIACALALSVNAITASQEWVRRYVSTNETAGVDADAVNAIVTNKGYVTESQVNGIVDGRGYQTASQVSSAITGRGYVTEAQATSIATSQGYLNQSNVENVVTSHGYQTQAQVISLISQYSGSVSAVSVADDANVISFTTASGNIVSMPYTVVTAPASIPALLCSSSTISTLPSGTYLVYDESEKVYRNNSISDPKHLKPYTDADGDSRLVYTNAVSGAVYNGYILEGETYTLDRWQGSSVSGTCSLSPMMITSSKAMEFGVTNKVTSAGN